MKIFIITCFMFFLTQVVFSLTEDQEKCVADIKQGFSKYELENATEKYTTLWFAQYAFLFMKKDTGSSSGASSSSSTSSSRFGVVNCETEHGSNYYEEILIYIANGPFAKTIDDFCKKDGNRDRTDVEIETCVQQIKLYFVEIPKGAVPNVFKELLKRFQLTYKTLTIGDIDSRYEAARDYFFHLSCNIGFRRKTEVNDNTDEIIALHKIQTAEEYCERIVPT